MRKILIAIMVILACSPAVFADLTSTPAPAAFADIGTVRAAGMGGAFAAIANDSNAVFYNPAGIPTSDYTDFSFMWAKHKDLVQYNYFSLIYPMRKLRGVGGAVIVSGDELINERTLFFSYAENLNWLLGIIKGVHVGANLKFHFGGYGNNEDDPSPLHVTGTMFGVGLDFGLLWQINSNLQFGLMVKDGFSFINWSNNLHDSFWQEGVPMTTDIGLCYKTNDMYLAIDLTDVDRIHIGVEKTVATYLDLRAGIMQELELGADREYSLGLGVGHFEFGAKRELSMNIDFAYVFEVLASTFKFQLSFKFK